MITKELYHDYLTKLNQMNSYKEYLKVDRKLLRPNKTKNLKANLKKAKKVLNYKVKTDIKNLIKIMMENELKQHNG